MANKRFWKFKNQADDSKTGELWLYGLISTYSWWGDEITPLEFKDDLDTLGDVSKIKIYIFSDGGDVFAGHAIYSMLKRHPAQKIVYIDGLAASIASVVAMVGDRIIMPRNAMMMMHNPWTWGIGYASDFRKLADDLDEIKEPIISTYEDKSGMTRAKIVELMDAESWITAEKALKYGLADEMEEEKQIAASISGQTFIMNGLSFDLSKFKNAPLLLGIKSPPEQPADPIPDKQADDSLLDLYIALNQTNQNRYRRELI